MEDVQLTPMQEFRSIAQYMLNKIDEELEVTHDAKAVADMTNTKFNILTIIYNSYCVDLQVQTGMAAPRQQGH